MVDPARIEKEMQWMRRMIEGDPTVLARFDIDGNGRIEGEEWDAVREMVIHRLEREEAERQAAIRAMQSPHGAGPEAAVPVGEPARSVFHRHIRPAVAPDTPFAELESMLDLGYMYLEFQGRSYVQLLNAEARSLGFIEQDEIGLNAEETLRRPFVIFDALADARYLLRPVIEYVTYGYDVFDRERNRLCRVISDNARSIDITVFGRHEAYYLWRNETCHVLDANDKVVGHYDLGVRVPFDGRRATRMVVETEASRRGRLGIITGLLVETLLRIMVRENRK